MAGRKIELGASGSAVAKNVTRIRGSRGLNYSALSKLLSGHGREIPPLAVRRIEEGERRVDVDDLLALAAALNVSPATLLMPAVTDENLEVEVTASDAPRTADEVWDWLTAARPLADRESEVSEGDQWVVFIHDAWPIWRVRQVYNTTFEEMQRRPGGRGPDGDG